MHGGSYQEVFAIPDAVGRAAKVLTEVSKIDTYRPKREPSSLKSYKTDSDEDEEENFGGDDIKLTAPFAVEQISYASKMAHTLSVLQTK